MIQTQVSSLNQETLPRPPSSFTPNLAKQDNFEYPDQDDEEYEEEDDSQTFYEDEEEEEEEDYPLVYYNLPTKKPDLKQEKLKAESLIKRNQQIFERKEQAKHHPLEPMNILKTSEKDHMSFKKIGKLPRPSAQARLVFEIAEKNLLVILFQDGKTLRVYNTLNFNLVTITKSEQEIKCMSYCKKLGRIIVGGKNGFLQLWSPKTFEVETECLQPNYQELLSVSYVAKSNVIVAKTLNQIRIYNTGLRFMTSLAIPLCASSWYSDTAEFFSLSKNLLLAVCCYGVQKGLILFNLKTGNRVDCSPTAFVPRTSSVVMTEKSPVNVFSCLGFFNSKPVSLMDDRYLFPLMQFTIDTKNEELVPLRSSSESARVFSKLIRIQNSKYFLAERFESYSSWKACFLSINKDQIEILRVMSGPSPMILNKANTYLMLKDRLSIVEVDYLNLIRVYKGIVYREKSGNSLEDSSPV